MTSRPETASRVRSRAGFTLIEVMIASLVLILVFISCITALQTGFKMIDNARMANLADQTIQSQIESLKLLNFSYIGGTPQKDAAGNWYFQSKQFTTSLAAATAAATPDAAGDRWLDFRPQIASIVGNVNASQLGRITAFRTSVVNSTDPTTAASRADVKRIKVQLQWQGLNSSQVFTREFETFYAKDGASDFYFTSFN